MKATQFVTTSLSALAIVGAVSLAYAQSTPGPAEAQTPATEAQPMTPPADTTTTPAATPAAPDTTPAPETGMTEPMVRADRN